MKLSSDIASIDRTARPTTMPSEAKDYFINSNNMSAPPFLDGPTVAAAPIPLPASRRGRHGNGGSRGVGRRRGRKRQRLKTTSNLKTENQLRTDRVFSKIKRESHKNEKSHCNLSQLTKYHAYLSPVTYANDILDSWDSRKERKATLS